MTTHYYSGLSFFMHHSTDVDPALAVLAESIPQLKPFVQDNQTINPALNASKEADYIKDRHPLFTPEAIELPGETPDDFASVKAESRDVKGEPRMRLFIPVVNSDYFAKSALVESVVQHVTQLFGRDMQLVVEYKTKNYLAFEDATRVVRFEKH